MSIDQQNQHQAASRPLKYWHAIQGAYRTANAATHHTVGFLLNLTVAVYFLFCILFLGLRYVVLPNIGEYKPQIERMATDALGTKVSIGHIEASWHGLRPHLSLGDVAIYDKNGNRTLNLPKASATLSWWSISVADLRLQSLEVERPDLHIVRNRAGQLHVGGILIESKKDGSGKGADWVLSQDEIVIRDGRIRWSDELRAAPELVLDKVNLVLRNDWRNHEFALRATPPVALSAPLDVRGVFEHPHFSRRISDVMQWKGEIYADVNNTELASWKPYVDYPFNVQQGRGSVQAWMNFDHAKVVNFTADLKLSDVTARLREDLDILDVAELSGRISVREELRSDHQGRTPTYGANGHAISLINFSMRTSDGLVLPTTTISESFTPGKGAKPAKTEVTAKLLDLEALANFAERLPLPPEQRRMLRDFAPRGTLQGFTAEWHGVYPEISSYRVKGKFEGLSLNAQPGRVAQVENQPAQAASSAVPGFRNLTGQVDLNERGGTVNLASTQLQLEAPGYLNEPVIPFDTLNMQANWSFPKSDQLLLEVRKMDFTQAEISGSLAGKHVISLNQKKQRKSKGTIDIVGKLNGVQLNTLSRYLPVQTPESLREWLSGALVAGTARDVNLKLRGDLAHFPFSAAVPRDKAKGEFSVSGKIENGRLNYAPDEFAKNGKAPLWPLLENIHGSFAFDRTSMEIRGERARTNGVDLANVTVTSPDLLSDDQTLTIKGRAQGPFQNFIDYVNGSPITEWIAHFTEETKASGNAQLALDLRLPLEKMQEAKVNGTLQFLNNTVTLQNVIPPLSAVVGKLHFNESGFSLNGLQASFLDGPLQLSGGSQRDGTILLRGDGHLSMDGVRRTYAAPAMQRLAKHVSGSTRYTTSIRVKDAQPEIVVESSMQGIALDFPAPLAKAAEESKPLKFELQGLPSLTADVQQDEIRMSLGSTVSAYYERQKKDGKDAVWRVLRGGIGINAPAPRPDSGVVANVELESLNADIWKDVISAIVTDDQPQPVNTTSANSSASPDVAQYIEPKMIAARATELIIMNRKLDNVIVGASQHNNMWQANIDSRQASGYVTWNDAAPGTEHGKFTARLASLSIPSSAVSEVTELLEGGDTATEMPALDIIADEFELLDKKFGRLELIANNARTSAGNEWQVKKLFILNPDGELNASGKWTSNAGKNLSDLSYTFNIADAGRLLNRFGFSDILRGGKGKMEGSVSWKGLPFSLDIPSLSGTIQLNIEAGQFLKVDPSAAKLLGVLSLQSLPRRLVLDFRDIFSEGFAFDGVNATATIAQGVLKTENFKMRSVAATVLIDGKADIAKESQDLHVAVIPEINVGAASVVYGLAVNPAIGVGTFLAQLFLREPLMRAFTFEYQITGPWKDPVVTKIARKLGDVPNKPNEDLERNG